MTSMFFSQQWADGVRDVLNAGPTEEALAGKLPEYWDFYNLIRYTYPSSWALGVRGLPDELGGGTGYLLVQWAEGQVIECRVVGETEPVEATYVLAADYHDWKALFEGYDALPFDYARQCWFIHESASFMREICERHGLSPTVSPTLTPAASA